MADPAFKPAIATGLAAFILGLGFLILNPGNAANTLREEAFDLIEAGILAKRLPDGVVVVAIDRNSLAEKDSWPWPRARYVDLVSKLQDAKPAVIGIDILLNGPDRRAPGPTLRELAKSTGRTDLNTVAASLPDDDKALGDTLARSDVVLGLLLDEEGKDEPPFPAMIARAKGAPTPQPSQAAEGVDAPLPVLVEGAVAVGALSFSAGTGTKVRQAPVFVNAANEDYAGFAVEVFRDTQQASAFVIDPDGATVSVGDRHIPLREGASIRLHLTSPLSWAARTVSAADVLDGKIPAERLAGRIVLIGATAPEAGAFLATAVAPNTPTVQVQAEAIEGLRSGDIPLRIHNPRLVEPVAAAALGLVALAAALWLGPLLASLILAVLILGWIGFSVGLFAGTGLLIDPVGPLIPAVAAANSALVVMFARTRKLRNAIERKFGRYLSPEIVRRLTAAPEELRIEGELREVTALFSDIEGFTTMSENAEPRTLVGALDAYFDGVCAIVIRHGGMVDKIVGDAVHGLFNAPLALPGHARVAMDCAIEIGRFTQEFRNREDARKLGFGRTRIGLDTGPVIVGDVGGLGHLDYTAHGDAVNSAARLEAINKQFGTTICLGARAAKAIGAPELMRPLGTVVLRGRAAETAVFSPWPDDATPQRRQAYLAAYELVKQDSNQALALFKGLAEQWPGDPAVAYWVKTLS
ncbi:adenylate/guanylate cyclase domain-containing protein [Labrys miyagiensis]|uniref:Adenylate/guanylate cyclase domain-containing protein n=1 Tax=Labrys miyagiensis TaxID=346912 RepID=A0ABQ6CC72_9HYPH|nr:adenylate/guanylate cyclase domain-containing protein [Labrys miyagiensis]GLS17735.1 adenylate/guanylate cyclase domain-containing protein [Labrys miyagiensis]